MSRWTVALVVGAIAACAGVSRAEDAIKKDRQLYAGTWQVVSAQVNGVKLSEADAKKIIVVNQEDGSWTLEVEGKAVARGTSKIDPTKLPKSIDLMVTEGDQKGQTALGVYAVKQECRILCLAELGKERPTEFSAKPGSNRTLVQFKRVKK